MDDALRKWTAELRERAEMPPDGKSEEAFRVERQAASAFQTLFQEPAPEGRLAGGHVWFDHRGALIAYDPDEGALYFQPRDRDGNRYGSRVRLKSLQQAVLAFEHGRVERDA